MSTQQTDALQCAADLEYSIARHGMQDAFTLNAYRAMKMVRTQQARITDLEAQLEAIGAGGVSGPLIGQPQAMPDLSQLTERGAKAWAGVDAQGLLEGFTAADMATAAAQPGVVYAELPAPNYPKSGGFPGTFAEAQMRAFADATHALRAAHGQAPAQAASSAVLKAIREANMQLVRTGDDAFMLVPYKAVTAQAADSVTAPAPPPECETEAEKRAFAFGWFKALESERMKAESVQEDAARYRFLRDGEWRDTDLEPFIRLQLNTLWDAKIDAARKQGASHDR